MLISGRIRDHNHLCRLIARGARTITPAIISSVFKRQLLNDVALLIHGGSGRKKLGSKKSRRVEEAGGSVTHGFLVYYVRGR
jgi:hypothetical protein